MKQLLNSLILAFLLNLPVFGQTRSLQGKVICIDPGHGGTAATDSYRVGPAGEREEWINLRVGLLLQNMLEDKGARVVITRTEDKMVELAARAKMAKEHKADLFISIHHNATADSSVNFPIIYFHGNKSENKASVAFGKLLGKALKKHLHNPDAPISLVADYTIFPDAGASVLRNTYGIPAVLAEASFFTNAAEEQRLKQTGHNEQEAIAYTEAIEAFFSKSIPKIEAEHSEFPEIPPFKVFQEAERMTPVAKNWKHDFDEAQKLEAKSDNASMQQAFFLYTRSAKSFPDSYVAAKCHEARYKLLKKMNRGLEAEQEKQRFREFYVEM